ncbi:MAG: response regulator, partial [Cyanobacteria bacterium J06639_18]
KTSSETQIPTQLIQQRAQPRTEITPLPKNNQIQENVNSEEQNINDSNHPKLLKKNLYTIACIDDSVTVLNSIKHFLDKNTFSVITINDPVKALMLILRSKPDLILLDVEMPNLDGYELCSLLRKHSSFKELPIVMVTGRTGFIDRAKAKMVRASGYLTKPFTQSDLLKAIFKHIS